MHENRNKCAPIYIYKYIHIYICVHIYIHIYMYNIYNTHISLDPNPTLAYYQNGIRHVSRVASSP